VGQAGVDFQEQFVEAEPHVVERSWWPSGQT
jgi:hypothetical protein